MNATFHLGDRRYSSSTVISISTSDGTPPGYVELDIEVPFDFGKSHNSGETLKILPDTLTADVSRVITYVKASVARAIGSALMGAASEVSRG